MGTLSDFSNKQVNKSNEYRHTFYKADEETETPNWLGSVTKITELCWGSHLETLGYSVLPTFPVPRQGSNYIKNKLVDTCPFGTYQNQNEVGCTVQVWRMLLWEEDWKYQADIPILWLSHRGWSQVVRINSTETNQFKNVCRCKRKYCMFSIFPEIAQVTSLADRYLELHVVQGSFWSSHQSIQR